MLHYNFPPYCTGEVGRLGSTGRREIGHGALAERSIAEVLPDDFPYSIRVVSEIMGSNGSSSMASICNGCLALMDAGVPLKATVAGISIGLFTNADQSQKVLVTDILGAEDHAQWRRFSHRGAERRIHFPDAQPEGLAERQQRRAECMLFIAEIRVRSIRFLAAVLVRQATGTGVRHIAPRIDILQQPGDTFLEGPAPLPGENAGFNAGTQAIEQQGRPGNLRKTVGPGHFLMPEALRILILQHRLEVAARQVADLPVITVVPRKVAHQGTQGH